MASKDTLAKCDLCGKVLVSGGKYCLESPRRLDVWMCGRCATIIRNVVESKRKINKILNKTK